MARLHGVLLAILVIAAVPTVSARETSDDEAIVLDGAADLDVSLGPSAGVVPLGDIDVEQDLSEPEIVDVPLDFGTVVSTEPLLGDGPVGATTTLSGSAWFTTPAGDGTVGSPMPAFLLDEENRLSLSFAFAEVSVDANAETVEILQATDEGATHVAATHAGIDEPPYRQAFALLEARVEGAPHVRYHLNTRHIAAHVDLDNALTGAHADASAGDIHRGAPSRAGAHHVPARFSQPALPAALAPGAAPAAPAARDQGADKPVFASLRTLGVAALATGVESQAIAIMVGAAVATAVVLIGLYSLFQSKDVLKSEIRRRIYKTIEENPGITIVGIAAIIGVKHQTICYHLQLLKKAGYVTAHQKGNKVLHFVNGAGFNDAHRELLALDSRSITMRVLAAVIAQPAIIKKDVAVAAGLTRTGGAWHVNKLVKLGLVREERHHGHCRLFPVEERIAVLMSLRATPEELPVDVAEITAPAAAATTLDAQESPRFMHPTG